MEPTSWSRRALQHGRQHGGQTCRHTGRPGDVRPQEGRYWPFPAGLSNAGRQAGRPAVGGRQSAPVVCLDGLRMRGERPAAVVAAGRVEGQVSCRQRHALQEAAPLAIRPGERAGQRQVRRHAAVPAEAGVAGLAREVRPVPGRGRVQEGRARRALAKAHAATPTHPPTHPIKHRQAARPVHHVVSLS